MDQTQLTALVFDPQKEDLFDTLGTWDRDLTRVLVQRLLRYINGTENASILGEYRISPASSRNISLRT